MLRLLNILTKLIIEAWHISCWPLRNCFISWSENWNTNNINNSAPNHSLLTAADESPPPTHNRSPKSVFTGRLKTPVCSLPSLLRHLLLFLHRRLRSRTGQRVDKGVLVLGKSPALTVSGGVESRKLQIITFFLENVDTLYPHHFYILSFQSLIPSSVTSQRWQNFWWSVSASFHQRYCNQHSLDQKIINHRPFSLLKWDFFFNKNLDSWFLKNVEVLKSIFDHQ